MRYEEFLQSKYAAVPESGIMECPLLPAALKPFQRAITSWALRRGRAAMFEGTGLGKTLQQLSWAQAVSVEEDARVLILTPLAVAEQTVAEAIKFGIPSVAYAADRQAITSNIVITNYERFDKFDISQFAGIVLDESGIIKSQDGKTRALLTEACAKTPWKLCCTATPAPNDYAELGQHAEFLGVMTAKEMLSMFFVHDGSIRANDHSQGADGWRLKRHAEKDFWRWLASWAVMIRHPSDLGFDAPEYRLPALSIKQVTVAADRRCVPRGMLFQIEALTLGERIAARKDTVDARVHAAVEIASREPDEPWLIWCNLNSEADAIERLLPNALQVAGRHPIDVKVDRLLGFKDGHPPMLISKPSLAGHGMNWQHCSRMIFVGLTDSFEQVYQAIRRCWRFGQTRPVDVYFVASELEGAVVANLRRKEDAFDKMLDAVGSHMRDLMREQVVRGRIATDSYEPQIPMEIPEWLM
ncbi:MAG: DEAD/DEAH box helicase [Cyanobacteria bacterium REEB65]|nr:DEAD/DEAH box helicase [Cyanobacteria bacterium REEB65]